LSSIAAYKRKEHPVKLSIAAFCFLFVFVAAGADSAPAEQAKLTATYISAADVQTALGRSPQLAVNPQPNLHVVDAGGYNVAVGAIHRPQSPRGVAAVHFQVSEVYHVLDGAATLVTGGTLVNAKVRPADSESVKFEDGPGESGSGIEGGASQRIKAGDIVIIPAGTPHWFSAIEGSISYLVIRVDSNRVLPVR
jgi:mannose-6-phosphate isomerase-like protein (cupin superfamily)